MHFWYLPHYFKLVVLSHHDAQGKVVTAKNYTD